MPDCTTLCFAVMRPEDSPHLWSQDLTDCLCLAQSDRILWKTQDGPLWLYFMFKLKLFPKYTEAQLKAKIGLTYFKRRKEQNS